MESNPGNLALAEALASLVERMEPESGDILAGTLDTHEVCILEAAADALRQGPAAAPALDYRAAIRIPGPKGKPLDLVLRPGVTVEQVVGLLAGAAVIGRNGKIRDGIPAAFTIPLGHNLLSPLVDWEARMATPRDIPLSPGACAGILRRAAAAGVQLPEDLDAALKANISPAELTALVDAALAPAVQTEEETDVVASVRLVRPALEAEAEVEVEVEHPDTTPDPGSGQEAYESGRAAFAAGVALYDSPFTGTHRAHWVGGWRDAQADSKDPAVAPAAALEDRPGYARALEAYPTEYALGVQACIDSEGNMEHQPPQECDTVEKRDAFNLGFTAEMVKRGWWDFTPGGPYQSPFHIRQREQAATGVLDAEETPLPSPAAIFALIESEDDTENARGLELARAHGRETCGGEDSGLLEDNPFPEASVAWEVWREGYLDVAREARGIQVEPEALPSGAKAFQEGRDAHAAGVPRDKCPHMEDGLASRMKAGRWLEGWDAAERERSADQ